MVKSEQVTKEKGKKLQWFFFVIVIPVFFTITLALIILTLSGINVFEKAEKLAGQIPGVSESAGSQQDDETGNTSELEATIANNNVEISQLKDEVENKQTTIDELEQQIVQLENDLESSTEVEKDEENVVTDLAVSFQEMDAEEAAPIIANMSEALAVQVLEEVSSEERGAILGQMEPETAAKLASTFLGSSSEE